MVVYAGAANCFDDTETLTFTPGPVGALGTPQTSVKGISRQRTKSQQWANSGFGGDSEGFVWLIFADTLTGGTVIKIGDLITDASSVVYHVNAVTYHKQINQWELTCEKRHA